MAIQSETQLFEPVKQLLEAQGYEVRSEVRDCDVVAVRDDEVVVIELKRSLNLDLILQGVERLKLTDAVYLAAPTPKQRGSRWRQVQQLCRRLGLGLITVSAGSTPLRATTICDPTPYRPRKDAKRRGLLLKEFAERSGDYNVGGSSRRPIVTAYREQALRVAAELERAETARVAELRKATGIAETGPILQRNYYGWFIRVSRGVYQLTPAGKRDLEAFAHVVQAQQAAEPLARQS